MTCHTDNIRDVSWSITTTPYNIQKYLEGSKALMSVYFCPHSVFTFGYLIEFMCLKSDLIDN